MSAARSALAVAVLWLGGPIASAAGQPVAEPAAAGQPVAEQATLPAHTAPAAAVTSPPAPAESSWLLDLYESARGAIVRIESDLGVGTGFLFHSPHHVATAYHVIQDAEWIEVAFSNGRKLGARVVAYDPAQDLAILELPADIPDVRPLLPYLGEVRIGTRVAAIGHPLSNVKDSDARLQGLLDWTLTSGIVGAVSESFVQTDAAVNPGNSGGPLLNERGEVVGVVSFKLQAAEGVNMAVRAKPLQALTLRIGQQPPPPRTSWARDAFEIGFMQHIDEDSVGGFVLGFGAVWQRRLAMRFRLGFVGGTIAPRAEGVIAQKLNRVVLELDTGLHQQFGHGPLGLSATLGGGAALYFESGDLTELTVYQADAACVPTAGAPCVLSSRVHTVENSEVRFMPMLSATVTLAILRVGYAYQFDIERIEDSVHRLLFTFAL